MAGLPASSETQLQSPGSSSSVCMPGESVIVSRSLANLVQPLAPSQASRAMRASAPAERCAGGDEIFTDTPQKEPKHAALATPTPQPSSDTIGLSLGGRRSSRKLVNAPPSRTPDRTAPPIPQRSASRPASSSSGQTWPRVKPDRKQASLFQRSAWFSRIWNATTETTPAASPVPVSVHVSQRGLPVSPSLLDAAGSIAMA